ncbi:hypothetical protein [Winogradskyella haliclonae]|uniref:Antitoxin component YwqK of YwqJK toxin-antitoxin module n=1 Tax=Winogradskyella haliclonae TaxID=2048558 RepID=A0ABQ2BWS8_9FLAO|nr:hypothetical protein [Winogradskyella haliclonae]GGI56894.1 hypothetical protein GCM10011444_12030 [Winogradskyella haliclonae]
MIIKKIYALFFLLQFLSIQSQEKFEDYTYFNDIQGMPIYYNRNTLKPYLNGRFIEESKFFPTGKVLPEREFRLRNGRMDGIVKVYFRGKESNVMASWKDLYPNGYEEINYVLGKRGNQINYFDSDNRNILKKANYQDGKLSSNISYYKDKTIETYYPDNLNSNLRLVKTITSDNKGNKKSEISSIPNFTSIPIWSVNGLHGKSYYYHDNGNVFIEADNFNGFLVKILVYDIDGSLFNGQIELPKRLYGVLGKVKANIKDGLIDGQLLGYHEIENYKIFEVNFQNGFPNGLFKLYMSDGSIRGEANFSNGILEGEFIQYLGDNVISKINFKKNNPITITTYDRHGVVKIHYTKSNKYAQELTFYDENGVKIERISLNKTLYQPFNFMYKERVTKSLMKFFLININWINKSTFDKYNSERVIYNSKGEIIEIITNNNGIYENRYFENSKPKEGIEKSYRESGVLSNEIQYKSGYKVSRKGYHKNGEISILETYKTVGECIQENFNEKGVLVKKVFYKNNIQYELFNYVLVNDNNNSFLFHEIKKDNGKVIVKESFYNKEGDVIHTNDFKNPNWDGNYKTYGYINGEFIVLNYGTYKNLKKHGTFFVKGQEMNYKYDKLDGVAILKYKSLVLRDLYKDDQLMNRIDISAFNDANNIDEYFTTTTNLPNNQSSFIGGKCTTNIECKSGYCLNGKCSTTLTIGSKCISNFLCSSGYCLNSKCSATLVLGSKCTSNVSCNSGYCLNGKCTTTLPIGSKCISNFSCNSGYCLNRKCTNTLPLGSKCTSNVSCNTGYCLNKKCTDKHN